jgi:hypothetical protein
VALEPTSQPTKSGTIPKSKPTQYNATPPKSKPPQCNAPPASPTTDKYGRRIIPTTAINIMSSRTGPPPKNGLRPPPPPPPPPPLAALQRMHEALESVHTADRQAAYEANEQTPKYPGELPTPSGRHPAAPRDPDTEAAGCLSWTQDCVDAAGQWRPSASEGSSSEPTLADQEDEMRKAMLRDHRQETQLFTEENKHLKGCIPCLVCEKFYQPSRMLTSTRFAHQFYNPKLGGYAHGKLCNLCTHTVEIDETPIGEVPRTLEEINKEISDNVGARISKKRRRMAACHKRR